MWSPLIQVLVKDPFDEERVRRYLCYINIQTKDGSSPLHFAALRGDPHFAKFLLENGAEVNQTNFFGESALHWAVKANKEQTLSALLYAGSSPDLVDSSGASPIDWAFEEEHFHLLPILRGSKRTVLSS